MAFCTGYQTIQRHSIKNLYSTNISFEYRTMRRRPESQRKVSRKPKYVDVTRNSQLITYEYLPEYKTYIPKAPAFRTVSRSKAKEIAERLSTRRPRTCPPAEVNENDSEGKPLHREASSLTVEDQRASVNRITQPTIASNVRLRINSKKGKNFDVKDIAHACVRLYLPPSQRYFPSAYKNWLNVNDKYKSTDSSGWNV